MVHGHSVVHCIAVTITAVTILLFEALIDSYHDVTHWFVNTQSEGQRLVLIYSAILSTCFVLKRDSSMFGCVGRTGRER